MKRRGEEHEKTWVLREKVDKKMEGGLCTLSALFKDEGYSATVPIIPCLQLVFISNHAVSSTRRAKNSISETPIWQIAATF